MRGACSWIPSRTLPFTFLQLTEDYIIGYTQDIFPIVHVHYTWLNHGSIAKRWTGKILFLFTYTSTYIITALLYIDITTIFFLKILSEWKKKFFLIRKSRVNEVMFGRISVSERVWCLVAGSIMNFKTVNRCIVTYMFFQFVIYLKIGEFYMKM